MGFLHQRKLNYRHKVIQKTLSVVCYPGIVLNPPYTHESNIPFARLCNNVQIPSIQIAFNVLTTHHIANLYSHNRAWDFIKLEENICQAVLKMFLASYVAVLSVIRQPPIDFMFTPKFTQPRKKRELE